VFRDSKGILDEPHLKNFYMIVPSLTISYVESFKNAKDSMDKMVRVRVSAATCAVAVFCCVCTTCARVVSAGPRGVLH
jgi:hypothetical protein